MKTLTCAFLFFSLTSAAFALTQEQQSKLTMVELEINITRGSMADGPEKVAKLRELEAERQAILAGSGGGGGGGGSSKNNSGSSNKGGGASPAPTKIPHPPRPPKKVTPVRPDPANPWTIPGAMWTQKEDDSYEYYRLSQEKGSRGETIVVIPEVVDGRVVWKDKVSEPAGGKKTKGKGK